jgi:hypothetical protein
VKTQRKPEKEIAIKKGVTGVLKLKRRTRNRKLMPILNQAGAPSAF